MELSATETIHDLGEITVQKGHKLSGKIHLPAGSALPPDSRVSLELHSSTGVQNGDWVQVDGGRHLRLRKRAYGASDALPDG